MIETESVVTQARENGPVVVATDPDDPVEVDQKSIEVVRQGHGPQVIARSRYGAD